MAHDDLTKEMLSHFPDFALRSRKVEDSVYGTDYSPIEFMCFGKQHTSGLYHGLWVQRPVDVTNDDDPERFAIHATVSYLHEIPSPAGMFGIARGVDEMITEQLPANGVEYADYEKYKLGFGWFKCLQIDGLPGVLSIVKPYVLKYLDVLEKMLLSEPMVARAFELHEEYIGQESVPEEQEILNELLKFDYLVPPKKVARQLWLKLTGVEHWNYH